MSIPFTQFVRPDGRKQPVTIDRPPDVEAKAAEVIARGGVFEVEELRTGEASFECLIPVLEISLACEIVPNGPEVLEAVDRLVETAYAALTYQPEDKP